MANWPDDRHHAVAAAYDFSKAVLIADIGGGNGEALRRILASFPDVRGIVFDREDVVAANCPKDLPMVASACRAGASSAKCRLEPTSICSSVCCTTGRTRTCHAFCVCVAPPWAHGRLLIVEQILPPDPSRGRATDYLVDMHMMAMFGGAQERTEAEFRALLTSAGFDLRRVIPTASLVSILEAAPR